MKWKRLGNLIFLGLLFLCATVYGGCVSQEADLVYLPQTDTDQTDLIPEATLKPETTPFSVQVGPVVEEAIPVDLTGIAIIDPQTHYFRYYLSFFDIRIYEEDDNCYLDGICSNSFVQPLRGKARIVFFDETGRTCGEGILHTAENLYEMNLSQGDNRVFAEVLAETDVSAYAFEIETESPFLPAGL